MQVLCLPFLCGLHGPIWPPNSIWPHFLKVYWECLLTFPLLHSSQASFNWWVSFRKGHLSKIHGYGHGFEIHYDLLVRAVDWGTFLLLLGFYRKMDHSNNALGVVVDSTTYREEVDSWHTSVVDNSSAWASLASYPDPYYYCNNSFCLFNLNLGIISQYAINHVLSWRSTHPTIRQPIPSCLLEYLYVCLIIVWHELHFLYYRRWKGNMIYFESWYSFSCTRWEWCHTFRKLALQPTFIRFQM